MLSSDQNPGLSMNKEQLEMGCVFEKALFTGLSAHIKKGSVRS